MSTNLYEEITLESTDGTLVAKNDPPGHLTYPLLFLDREPTPEDAQDWDQVLIFLEGNVKYQPVSGESSISPTSVILFEENNFSQALEIQTMEPWSISDVSPSIQVAQIPESNQIVVTKAPALTELGIHSCSFTVTLDGTIQTQKIVQVYVIIGGMSRDFNIITIDLDEDHGYSQPLDIPVEGAWKSVGVNSAWITGVPNQGTGAISVTVSKNTDTPGVYMNVFAVTDPSDTVIAVVFVRLTVTKLLRVEYKNKSYNTLIDSAENGETLTITLEEPNYTTENLYIIRDTAWEIFKDAACTQAGVDSNKISLSPTSGTGSTSPPYSTLIGTFSKASPHNPSGFDSTEFWVKSRNQVVHVVVEFTAAIAREFVNPQSGEAGVTGTEADPVYLYI
jgi:hypothetical protein